MLMIMIAAFAFATYDPMRIIVMIGRAREQVG